MTDQEREMLLLDYDKTLAFIDKAEGHLFQIRNWAIVSCSAVVAFAVSQQSPIVLAANVFLVSCFCLLEVIYKSFHEDGIQKSYYLEEVIQKSSDASFQLPEDYQFGIGHTIALPRPGKLLRILFNRDRWHIGALYVGLFLLTALAAAYLKWLVLNAQS